jgi:hypothetical protein
MENTQMAKQTEAGRRIYRANQSFVKDVDGVPTQFGPSVTVREGHPVMLGHEHLFEILEPDFEVAQVDYETPRASKPEFEQATAAPNETRGR